MNEKIQKAIEEAKETKSLDLGNMGLSEIPQEIFDIQDLGYLYLNNNNLEDDFMEEFCKFHNLSHLDLSGNNLTEIPEGVYFLWYLTTLDVSKNKITKVTDDIKSLNRLEALYLNDNEIDYIDPSLFEDISLDYFSYHKNKLSWENAEELREV